VIDPRNIEDVARALVRDFFDGQYHWSSKGTGWIHGDKSGAPWRSVPREAMQMQVGHYLHAQWQQADERARQATTDEERRTAAHLAAGWKANLSLRRIVSILKAAREADREERASIRQAAVSRNAERRRQH
jgi:hypothetical protein